MADELRVDLGRLFKLLRDGGFRVDARQYLTAAELLIETARRGEPIDTDAERLGAHLGPIFCTSPDEQVRFERVVSKWLDLEPPPPVPASMPAPFARLRRVRRTVGIIVGLAVLGAAVPIGYVIYKKTHIVVAPPLPDAGPPLSDAGPQLPDAGPPPALRVVPLASFEPTFQAAAPPPVRMIAWWRVALAAGSAGALVLMMWFGVGWLRRRLVLQRLPSAERSEFAKLAGGADSKPLFADVEVRRASTALRRPRSEAAQELQILASVEGAGRAAGLVVPVYKRRRAIPEYVAFIERHSAADHQARLCDELLDRLQDLGVAVERYYFTGDPRTCFAAGETSRSTLLADAVGRNHRAAALLFTDAGRCFNPFTGQPEPWLETLRSCPRRALLTSEPPRAWTRYATDLTALGFVVTGASEQGLTKFGELEGDADVERRGPVPYARPYPRLLAGQSALATTRVCPPADVVERLVRELQGYLGPRAFIWLAACAVYPELDWLLTLHLSQAVWATTDGPPREDDMRTHLVALARLPWFRLGGMPDWLRKTLLSQLTHDQEQEVRVALAARLEELARQTLARRGGVAPSAIQIAAWVDPIELVRTAHPDSPMNDAVFLGYMGGARIPSGAVAAPSAFRRLFGRVGSLPGERRVRAAHRSWRQRLAASLRSLRVYHPALAGALLALLASGAAFAVALPLSTTAVVVAKSDRPPLASAVFTPSGDRLLVAAGTRVDLWDLKGEREEGVNLLSMFESPTESLSYRPDGTLVRAERSGNVYEAKEGNPIKALMTLIAMPAKRLALLRSRGLPDSLPVRYGPAADGTMVAFGPQRAFVWKGSAFVGEVDATRGADLSADGKVLAAVNRDGNATFYEVSDLRVVLVRRIESPASVGALSADGFNLLLLQKPSALAMKVIVTSAIRRVDAPEPYEWTRAEGFDLHGDLALLVATQPSVGPNAHFFVWDLRSGAIAEVAQVQGYDGRGVVSNDGRTVAIYDSKTVQLFSIERDEKPQPDAGAGAPDAGTDGPAQQQQPQEQQQRLRRCPALSSIAIDAKGNIAPGGDAAVKANAACIYKHPEWKKIDVVGATGTRGTAEYNVTLSVVYAKRVRDLLVKAGVDASRLQFRGVGEERPLCKGTSDACEARNRRVEVLSIGETVTPPAPDAGAPVAPAPVDAGPARTSSFHSIATGPISVRFGGPPYCWYQATMTNVDMTIVMDDQRRLQSAAVTATFEEAPAEGCSQPSHVAKNEHRYVMRSAGPWAERVFIEFEQQRGQSRTTLAFDGLLQRTSASGVLIFRRTDQPTSPSLQWMLRVPIPSTGPIVSPQTTTPEAEAKKTGQLPDVRLDIANARVEVSPGAGNLGALGIKPKDVLAAMPDLQKRISTCLITAADPRSSQGIVMLGLRPHDRPIQGPPSAPAIEIVSATVDRLIGPKRVFDAGAARCITKAGAIGSASTGLTLVIPFSIELPQTTGARGAKAD